MTVAPQALEGIAKTSKKNLSYDKIKADVDKMFNPKAFIHCGTFPTLGDCADHVVQVHMNDRAYASYIHEERLTLAQLKRHFSWHPDVHDTSFAEALRMNLGLSLQQDGQSGG